MRKDSIFICLLGLVFIFISGSAQAVLINFDDLAQSGSAGTNLPANYNGISWDTNVRYFSENTSPGLSDPKSGQNYIYNQGSDPSGPIIGFSILDPSASVVGAWFTQFGVGADQVRFLGLDAGNNVVATSGWLSLTATPQFLAAEDTGTPFPVVSRIEIEHLPIKVGPDFARYSLDDLTITPEPISLALLALGSGFVMRHRRRR